MEETFPKSKTLEKLGKNHSSADEQSDNHSKKGSLFGMLNLVNPLKGGNFSKVLNFGKGREKPYQLQTSQSGNRSKKGSPFGVLKLVHLLEGGNFSKVLNFGKGLEKPFICR